MIVYVETLLYIVHVDDIDLPISSTDGTTEEVYDVGNEQQLSTTNQMSRRLSKRTTASFNERHQTSKEPIYSRPSFAFANPLRRLNSKLMHRLHFIVQFSFVIFQVYLNLMINQRKVHPLQN